MDPRLKNIYARLEKEGLDGLIVSANPNISYLTRYPSRESYLVISPKGNIFLTDSRYIEEAKRQVKGAAAIEKINGSVFKLIAEACQGLGLKRAGFEERNLAFAEYRKIRQYLNKPVKLIPTHGLIEGLRQIKDSEEIKKIRQAIRITAQALELSAKCIKPGKSELEVAAEFERYIRRLGAEKSAFDIIVAAGANSSFPHHLTSGKKIRNNQLLLIDMGIDYQGYKTDLTRVFFLGKIKGLIRKVYEIVQEAQVAAISQIKPGNPINKVDSAARQCISRAGYAKFFGHNTGHGLGLEVHEEPHISANETRRLEAGMVFTVEPAIYLPAKFGIRIEDMVLVTTTGCEVLSGSVNQ